MWEYKTVEIPTKQHGTAKMDKSKADMLMNDMGKEGWELVGFVQGLGMGRRGTAAIFKRPMREAVAL